MAMFRAQLAGTSDYVTFEHPSETVVEVWLEARTIGYLLVTSTAGEGGRKVLMPLEQIALISLEPN